MASHLIQSSKGPSGLLLLFVLVATALGPSLATANLDSRDLTSYSMSGKVQRIECPTHTPESFGTFVALAVEGDVAPSVESLRNAHREGTALQCDPFQRALQDSTELQHVTPAPDEPGISLALYEAHVLSYNVPTTVTALEPPYPNFVAVDNHPLHPVCRLDDITDNEASNDDSHEDCPRYGCYCPANLLHAPETTGVTEDQLQSLLNQEYSYYYPTPESGKKGKGSGKKGTDGYTVYTSSGKKGGGYSSGKKSSGKGKKGPEKTVQEVAELRAFSCENPDTFETAFEFTLSQDPCLDVGADEWDAFAAQLTQRTNQEAFNDCDIEFKSLMGLQSPQPCQVASGAGDRRDLQFVRNFTALLPSLVIKPGNVTSTRFLRDVRRRSLWERIHITPPSSSRSLLSWLSSPFLDDATSERGLYDDDKELMFDYGSAFNYKNDLCYCPAFVDNGGGGVSTNQFLELSNQVLQEVTQGRVSVLGVEELDPQKCGTPRIFTQVVSVIANGDEDAMADLSAVLAQVLDTLSLEKCVKSHFQILTVDLVFQEKKWSTKRHAYAWALQFQVQYVAFGVQGPLADLYKVPPKKPIGYGKKSGGGGYHGGGYYGKKGGGYDGGYGGGYYGKKSGGYDGGYDGGYYGKKSGGYDAGYYGGKKGGGYDGGYDAGYGGYYGGKKSGGYDGGYYGKKSGGYSSSSYHRDLQDDPMTTSLSHLLVANIDQSHLDRTLLPGSTKALTVYDGPESPFFSLSHYEHRQLESILIATSCVCDIDATKKIPILPLELVNRELDEAICSGAVPGVTFAMIVH